MAGTAAEFQKYSKAMPAARAAQDMNKLGDSSPDGAKTTPLGHCLERLPLDADALNKQLGLKPGTITSKMLRNDQSGFRAALYRDDATGKLILVPRDTEPHSLMDWETNIYNGLGQETKQYDEMKNLAQKLYKNDVNFDVGGYSKGGGLAQVAGLFSPNSNVSVFNSAGIPDFWSTNSGISMSNLESRVSAFSAQGDFLTQMNNTVTHAGNMDNMQFLYDQLSGNVSRTEKYLLPGGPPIQIKYLNPETQGIADSAFTSEKTAFLTKLKGIMNNYANDPTAGSLFPPVRTNDLTTIPNSMSFKGEIGGAKDPRPNLGHLAQHQISNIVQPMQDVIDKDRKTMKDFLQSCG